MTMRHDDNAPAGRTLVLRTQGESASFAAVRMHALPAFTPTRMIPVADACAGAACRGAPAQLSGGRSDTECLLEIPDKGDDDAGRKGHDQVHDINSSQARLGDQGQSTSGHVRSRV